MKPKHRRLTFVVIGAGLLAAAAALILSASRDALVFFKTPSEIIAEPADDSRRLRIGGLVEEGSVERSDDAHVRFRVTDTVNAVAVTYIGVLPDLFREGQGVVAEGQMRDGVFVADQVLAKHDENYMPPEVADAVKASGQWRDATQKTTQETTGGVGVAR